MTPRLGINLLPSGKLLKGKEEILTIEKSYLPEGIAIRVAFKREPGKLIPWVEVLKDN